MSRAFTLALLLGASSLLAACGSSFVASNGGRMRTDDAARATHTPRSAPMLARLALGTLSSNPEPQAKFPATLAIASSRTGDGDHVRDIEEGIDLTALKSLEGVRDVIVLPSATPLEEVYVTAQSADADIIVVYEVTPARSHRGTSVPGLGVLTLGAFPNEYEKAYATASASFIDSHTGFVYATAEATASSTEVQNAWQGRDNTVHLKAQRAALRALLKESRKTWKTVHERFARAE
jgi:hypothetical protein